ncbi:MAG: hypothetical protein RLY93_19190 [Sumerlaeia bacterium]
MYSESGVYEPIRSIPGDFERDNAIPSVFSGEFSHFVSLFLRDPSSNPMFFRLWARTRRRLGPFASHLWLWALFLGLFFGLLLPPAGLLLGKQDVWLGRGLILGVIVFSHFIAVLWALLAGISATQKATQPGLMEELAVTPLKPDEIAWGLLTGSLLPILCASLTLWPSLVIWSLFFPEDPVLPSGFLIPLALLHFPHLAASILSTGALAIAMTYGRGDSPLPRIAVVLMFLGVLLWIPLLILGVLAWPASALIILPLLTLLKLGMAGGFFEHLSNRLAEARARH